MIVLDCSAAVAIILETEEGAAFTDLILRNEKIISPQLFIAELNSALAKYVRAGDLEISLAHTLLLQALDLVDEFVDMYENNIEAFDEAIRNSCSPHDMFYFTLARRNGATLFTLDRRLISLCSKLKVDCVHVLSAMD